MLYYEYLYIPIVRYIYKKIRKIYKEVSARYIMIQTEKQTEKQTLTYEISKNRLTRTSKIYNHIGIIGIYSISSVNVNSNLDHNIDIYKELLNSLDIGVLL